MHTTPVSLLERVRDRGERDAWARFVELYTPLLLHWACASGLQPADAADLVQEVLTTLVQKLPEFQYQQDGSFRRWLKALTLNKWRDRWRRRQARPGEVSLAHGAEPAAPDPAALFEKAEYQQRLVARALEVMQREFHPTTWKACWEHAVSGRSAAGVAAELGISEGAVYVAKSRVLRRLREELRGLIE
jgi:RNA polymerase sigma-70 factor (ECF subfamily)